METTSVKVGKASEIGPGDRKIVEVDGTFVAIFNVGGTYYAIEDVCSHDGGPVAEGDLDGFEIECPRHGARFDIRDGRVLCFPAIRPIRSFKIAAQGDDLILDLS
jgi:3-phenylpropionate/trans-cinnamate dioxygenase ferredoxin subunit